jgi:hypothetical protein
MKLMKLLGEQARQFLRETKDPFEAVITFDKPYKGGHPIAMTRGDKIIKGCQFQTTIRVKSDEDKVIINNRLYKIEDVAGVMLC